jgi:hypothetical protein
LREAILAKESLGVGCNGLTKRIIATWCRFRLASIQIGMHFTRMGKGSIRGIPCTMISVSSETVDIRSGGTPSILYRREYRSSSDRAHLRTPYDRWRSKYNLAIAAYPVSILNLVCRRLSSFKSMDCDEGLLARSFGRMCSLIARCWV